MEILKVSKIHIYAYHDYTFFLFDREQLKQSMDEKSNFEVGLAWPVGKTNDPKKVKAQEILKNSLYHRILIETLLNRISNSIL